MKFRKRPVVIEAVQFNTPKDIRDFSGSFGRGFQEVKDGNRVAWFHIETLEGVMKLEPKDWLIRGIKGEFYPCKPDIFEATYEKAQESGE